MRSVLVVKDAAPVQMPSGLIVPATAVPATTEGARDPDGRRRAVVTDDERRIVKRAIDILGRNGVGVQFRCTSKAADACGDLLGPEAQDTHDKGFGCRCSRLHLAP